MRALIDCFDVFAGENYFKVRGRRLGFWYLGADMWWRRRDFDRRFDTGLFAPKDRRLVTAPELAGLLKPPSVHCRADNVVRSGGLIPAAPRALPGTLMAADCRNAVSSGGRAACGLSAPGWRRC